ncbi:MAG: tetratricopeptide repeat protein [Bacteroidota bacterium]
MALISTNSGDRFGGQELSLEAVSYFDESNPKHHVYLLSIYNNLGIASYSLKQYQRAIDFYTKSLQFITDSAQSRVVKNNIANAYRKAGNTDKAVLTYESILKEEQEPVNRARTLSNYAYTRWLSNSEYNPETSLREALKIRLKGGDLSGQTSSYAHLADYYLSKNRDSAFFYSSKMYRGANSLHSAQDQIEALQKLIPLSSKEDAKMYFNRYTTIEDSLQTAWNSAKNQFAVIRYETEKHKADNLLLQQINTTRNIWIISLTIVLVGGSIFAILWLRRREKFLALKTANAVKDSQLKTSKRVHDVVANGLYRVISQVENNTQFDRDQTLDDLEILYEKSRDISYEDITLENVGGDFKESVRQLLTSFASSDTKVLIVGNTQDIWDNLGIQARTELYYVLQELMVNMTKHSGAKSVAIRFERISNNIMVYYTDDGRGIAKEVSAKNGLTNTGNRIKTIGGTIIFGKGTSGGLNVQIEIPVSR